jgi:N-acetylglucosamine-6-phosphate deacetylase
MRRLGVQRALVDGEWVRGDVEIDDGLVGAVGVASDGGRGDAVPGFIDVQVNGFAGVDFSDCDLDGYRLAAAALGQRGVTSFLATIPTAAPDRYASLLDAATGAVREPLIGARALGIHLEGPFLTRPGAHRQDWFQAPSRRACDVLLSRAPVVMMTVAPDAPGGLDLIRHLTARGVVASIGHTEADAALTHAAFDAGGRAVTHLWNAQTTVSSRAAGVVGAALARRDVFVGLIADLIHVCADTLTLSLAALAARAVVVSDASPWAGLPGRAAYHSDRGSTLGADDGVRLDDGTLAGGAAPLDVQLRNIVALGFPLEQAVGAMTSAPAALLGARGLGRLRPGDVADVVVLGEELDVRRTLVAGVEA